MQTWCVIGVNGKHIKIIPIELLQYVSLLKEQTSLADFIIMIIIITMIMMIIIMIMSIICKYLK